MFRSDCTAAADLLILLMRSWKVLGGDKVAQAEKRRDLRTRRVMVRREEVREVIVTVAVMADEVVRGREVVVDRWGEARGEA